MEWIHLHGSYQTVKSNEIFRPHIDHGIHILCWCPDLVKLVILKQQCILEKNQIPGVPSYLIGDVTGEDIAWGALSRIDRAKWDTVIEKNDNAITEKKKCGALSTS